SSLLPPFYNARTLCPLPGAKRGGGSGRGCFSEKVLTRIALTTSAAHAPRGSARVGALRSTVLRETLPPRISDQRPRRDDGGCGPPRHRGQQGGEQPLAEQSHAQPIRRPQRGRAPVGDLELELGHLHHAGDQRDDGADRPEKPTEKNARHAPAREEAV